jgi:HlyD family secretion protein
MLHHSQADTFVCNLNDDCHVQLMFIHLPSLFNFEILVMIKVTIQCCFILLLIFSCKRKQEKINPIEEKITESVYASGIVKSKNQYQVYSSVNGLIGEVLVTEGELVHKGDAIIRLTNTSAKLNVDNAQLAANYATVNANNEKLAELKVIIEQAKYKLDNDQLLLERQKNLWAQQIGSRNELEQRELAYKNSLKTYEAAKLRYTEMQKQISFQEKQAKKNVQIATTIAGDFTIKSEVAGKVYSILKEKGEMVNTQTTIALIGDAIAFILELQIDEYDITKIKAGQKVVLSMDSYKGQTFEATVTKINPIMNERTKSFTVEATFIQMPPTLYPNLTCEANIVIQQKEKVITIPRNYLLPEDYVLLENNEKRKVTTGLKDYQKVEIRNGLTVKDVLLKPAP